MVTGREDQFPPLDKGGSGRVAGLEQLQVWQGGADRWPSPHSLRAEPLVPPLLRGGGGAQQNGSKRRMVASPGFH